MRCYSRDSTHFLINLHFALAYKEIDFIEFPLVNLDIFSREASKNFETCNSRVKIINNKSGIGLNIPKNYFKKYKFIKKSGFSI